MRRGVGARVSADFSPGLGKMRGQVVAAAGVKSTSPGEGRRVFRAWDGSAVVGETKRGSVRQAAPGEIIVGGRCVRLDRHAIGRWTSPDLAALWRLPYNLPPCQKSQG